MKSVCFLLTATIAIILAFTLISALAQDTEKLQKGLPNQMEPLNRQARQFWEPPKWNPPGTFPGYRSRLGLGIGGALGVGINIGGLLGIGASIGIGGGIGAGIGAASFDGGLQEQACDILCPDDDGGFIPYRSPRPTKGKFIPIRG